MSETTAQRLERLSDEPAIVLSTYLLILTPLALYVYHDILDTRWRPVWRLVKFLIAYVILYLTSGAALLVYIYLQGQGRDFKEVGASILALILGTYGAWKLIRLARIILAHRQLVLVLQRIDIALCKLTGLSPVGLEYHLFKKPQTRAPPKALARSNWDYETRHDFISSSLFDDDYPGDAARIRWLAFFGRKVVVVQDDADECASRVAVWMRLVLRRPRSEPWRLLTSTSPLVRGHLYCISLGEALRALITHGSGKPPPTHANINPAQELLNNGNLTEVGVGFFWVASEMSPNEMTEVLAEMPPRWMRGVTQTGKQLMFELVMSLLLCEMPEEADPDLRWILSLPVLQWRRDVSNFRVWGITAEICADAVVSMMPRYTALGKMPPPNEIHETVRKAVFELKDATSELHGFQGDIVGLTLIELLRASYRAGYMVETIIGSGLEDELDRYDWTDKDVDFRLYKAEIVTGLFSILVRLGQDAGDEFQSMFTVMKKSWGVDPNIDDVMLALKAQSRNDHRQSFNLDHEVPSQCWYFGDREGRCEDPPVAFATVATIASDLAPFVLRMLQSYLGQDHLVYMHEKDPDRGKEIWMTWKKSQAYDISGSTETIRVDDIPLHNQKLRFDTAVDINMPPDP